MKIMSLSKSKLNKENILLLVISLFVLFFPELALAGTGGSEFQTLYNTVSGYITGLPMMIILTIAFGYSIIQLIRGAWAPIMWTIFAAITTASIDTIISAMVTAI
ncbi:MAG: hypothetical protein ACI9IL_000772 [Rickettsiales bacterium]|jgi:hypothetical protein